MIAWILIAGSSGVRINIINSTNMPMKKIQIRANKQIINVHDIQENHSASVVFDSEYEVESLLIKYVNSQKFVKSVPIYIEINSPMYVKVVVHKNGKVVLEESQHLLLGFHPLEVFENYWERIRE